MDDKKQDTMPSTPLGQGGKYYKVDVSCGSSKTQGLWDYNAWRLNLDYIESNSKCNLTFTSTMSKEEYDEYIESGIALRRNTYRGKDITDYFKGTKKFNDKDLYKQISDGTFDDIYVGDYIKTNEGGHEMTWLIADIDNYLNTGITPLEKHHATIIPASNLGENKPMNVNATTGIVYSDLSVEEVDGNTKTDVAAYMGSMMKYETLPEILNKYIKPVFKTHIIEYENLLSDKMNENSVNQTGQDNGSASGWGWYKSQLDLMSEVNVYGSTGWSSSGYDIGIDKYQYALFKLNPKLINSDLNNKTISYWLKGVVKKDSFTAVSYTGTEASAKANDATMGVRPRFLID